MQMDVKRTENIIRYWVLLQEMARQKETILSKEPQNLSQPLGDRMKVLPNLAGRG